MLIRIPEKANQHSVFLNKKFIVNEVYEERRSYF